MSTNTAKSALAEFVEYLPDISAIVTEDDQPVDNIYAEKQQRLLTEPLYTSWSRVPGATGEPRSFLAAANVGVFPAVRIPPLVPDVLVSLDVEVHPDFLREKRHKTYFCWEHGKPPDVVIEVVSNREGDELGQRRAGYARMRVSFYVVWDPAGHLGKKPLSVFELHGNSFRLLPEATLTLLDTLGLGLTVWEGTFEGACERWLRWALPDGTLLPTGAERAEAEARRADEEARRAETEARRAETEARRAETEARRAETEAEARRAAEAELLSLRAELARLRQR